MSIHDIKKKIVDSLKSNGIEERPYQNRIIAASLDHFNKGINSVMIESPCGAGKSLMGLITAKVLQQALGLKIGWCAMRRNLLVQVNKENERVGVEDLRLISMFDKNPPKVDLLIVDEAQHDPATSSGNIHFKTKATKILGLTATPYRTDRVSLCFQKVLRDAGIHQLIRQGYLSPYHHYTIEQYTPDAVAKAYLDDISRWGKSVVFFHKYEECLKFQSFMHKGGVNCELVSQKSNRDKQIGDFDKGKVKVLVNMNILTEGFDSPSTKTVFVRPSCKGPSSQMAGRAFRIHPDLAYKQIVQCKQTDWHFAKTATPDKQFIHNSGIWEEIGNNDNVNLVAGNVVRMMASVVIDSLRKQKRRKQ